LTYELGYGNLLEDTLLQRGLSGKEVRERNEEIILIDNSTGNDYKERRDYKNEKSAYTFGGIAYGSGFSADYYDASPGFKPG
jgi:hypothetical protein